MLRILSRLRWLPLLWVGLVCLLSSVAAVVPSSLPDLVQRFDEQQALGYIHTLSTEFDGRRAGTLDGQAAAQFIAAEFQRMGLQPAGDNGTYFQRFQMPFLDLAETPELSLLHETGQPAESFQHRVDFREFIVGYAGPGRAEAGVVYAAHGTSSDFASFDVQNQIALIVPSDTSTGTLWPIAAEAARRGASGVLFLASDDSRAQIKPSYIVGLAPRTIPTMVLTRAAVNALLAKSGQTVDTISSLRPFALDVRVRMSVVLQPIVTVTVSNVLGLLPGRDQTLKDEVVIVGGHYDHVGRDPNGTVFPGANDNASGIAVTMAMAQLFTSQHIRPKASILFVGWGAEEAGTVGSAFYVQHPKSPLTKTLGSLVLDVVGRGDGPRLEVEGNPSSLLSEIQSSASALGFSVNASTDGGGSDHKPFLDANVPATLFIWDGSVPLIHRSDDTFDKIDPAKLRTTGMIVALAALNLAGVVP